MAQCCFFAVCGCNQYTWMWRQNRKMTCHSQNVSAKGGFIQYLYVYSVKTLIATYFLPIDQLLNNLKTYAWTCDIIPKCNIFSFTISFLLPVLRWKWGLTGFVFVCLHFSEGHQVWNCGLNSPFCNCWLQFPFLQNWLRYHTIDPLIPLPSW